MIGDADDFVIGQCPKCRGALTYGHDCEDREWFNRMVRSIVDRELADRGVVPKIDIRSGPEDFS